MKKLFALILTLAMMLSVMAMPVAQADEIPTIKWIQVGSGMPANYDAWKVNLDKYLEEKIGVHIDVEVISWGDWASRRNVIVNTNEPFDILFTNGETFAGDVDLGAFLDITDMVKTASPALYDTIPSMYWDACRINGQIYGVPTYKDSSCTQYFVLDKELAEKYNFDFDSIKTLQDLSEGFAAVRDGEGITPFVMDSNGITAVYTWYDQMGAGLPAMGVRYDDGERKVVAVFEQEDVQKDLATLHQWYADGIINQDAATAPENPKYRFGYVAQGWSAAAKTVWGPQMGVEAIALQWGDTVVSNDTVQGSMSCISSSSKHPEKALELLQLVNTDSYVRDALRYGLEGDDFYYTEDGRIHRNNEDWNMAGYTQGTFFVITQLDTVDFNEMDEVKALNEAAKPSVLLGFAFDYTDVADERANCIEIYNRYKSELQTGTIDPVEGVANMMEEMRAAGFDKLVEAAQAQIDAQFK